MIDEPTYEISAPERIARVALIVGIVFLAAGVVWSLIGLYGDGSYLLLDQLTKKTFWLNNSARTFAAYATQAPVILALHAGVQNLRLLIYLQTFGLILPLALWVATLVIHRRSDFFWLFVFTFIVSFLTSGFAITGEYNLAVALTAFSAAILLRHEAMELWSAAALVACSILLVRCYESTVFLGPLLMLFCAVRFVRAGDGTIQKAALAIATIAYAIGVAVAVDSIRHPINPKLLAGALDFGPFRSKHFHYLLGIGACSAIAAVLRGRALMIAIGVGCALSLIYILNPSWWSLPLMHYYNRTISGVMVFVVLAVGGIAVVAASAGFRFRLARGAPIVAACFLVTCGPFCYRLVGFRAWLVQFEREIVARQGVVPIEKTPLGRSLYGWSWSNPSLSAVIKGRSPGAIIANESTHTAWEPYPATDMPVVPFDRPSPLF